MSDNSIDWKLCIICQKKNSENLRCPVRNQSDVYGALLNNVEEFRKLTALPVSINFGTQGTVEVFLEKKASWHRSCHQKFNNSMLKRVQTKRKDSEEGSSSNRPKRRCPSLSISQDSMACIFCEDNSISEHLHKFCTFNSDKAVKTMAADMNDTDLLVKLADSDLVAIDAMYHFTCLTTFRNRYRSHIRSDTSSASSLNTTLKRAKARAFTKVVSYIESGIEDETYIFKLSDLHGVYQICLEDLGVDISINKTRLKNELLEHFKHSAVQEQYDGKNTLLLFPEGMHEVLENVSDYKNEALKVAKVIREEMFVHEHFKFSGSFPQNCQGASLPYGLKLLISMILDGTTSKATTDSQACLTISQLIVHNSKKKVVKVFSEPKKGRHSLSREPPLPIYFGLKVHSVNRSKKLIDELCSLGISISYDRVLQLENNIAFTMCKQFESDGIVCPSILRKGLVTIGAIDNIDHNPSSATAHSSFHGTGITITQFPTLDAMGDGRELVQFTGGATESCGSLPLSYSTVPSVSLDASKASVPEKNYTISDVDLDRCMVKEDAWLKQVLDLLEENKQELFAFITDKVSLTKVPEGKSIYVTSGKTAINYSAACYYFNHSYYIDTSVIALGGGEPMNGCNHEEADSRMFLHVIDSLQRGFNTVAIRTVDTDVIVILIGEFHAIHEAYPNASIWIAFGTGKNFCYYHINTMYANLGKDKSRCLPVFHAFTGCDSTSSFFGKTKKSIWAAWNCFPQVSDAFLLIANNPFYQVDLESPYFQL